MCGEPLSPVEQLRASELTEFHFEWAERAETAEKTEQLQYMISSLTLSA